MTVAAAFGALRGAGGPAGQALGPLREEGGAARRAGRLPASGRLVRGPPGVCLAFGG
ncbi:MAG: hypothetical protein LBT40_13840 [Deltaproteobacteria bacterium]|nr:hypothetical protein [Deltaproteobacteria bacterium]